MNISNVHGPSQLPALTRQPAGDSSQGDLFSQHSVGDHVVLDVVRRVDGGRYLASFGGEQHVMESSVPLDIGTRVQAVVVRIGERLELRYVGAAPSSSDRDSSNDDQSSQLEQATPEQRTLLASLEARYHLALAPDEHTRLERAANRADDPEAMALGGLYLIKLGVPVEDAALQALHEAQTSSGAASIAHSRWEAVAPLLKETASGDRQSTQELAQVIGTAVPESPTQTTSGGSPDMGDGQSDPRQRGDLARLLLNLQDEGSVGYRYGTLPVLVGGQLVELSLVVLQQRQQQNAAAPVRRLVMNVPTESFGNVRIDARALENRLVVTFSGASPANSDELAACQSELQQLLKRLGWNVEGIDYRFGDTPHNGARDIIAHVLSAGTVDMLL